MDILLVSINEPMINAWNSYFLNEPVVVLKRDITQVHTDAIVSPANSFGFMDGGLDYALSERFGWGLEKRLQARIKELPEGELLIGKAMAIETLDDLVPFLISAPTMRVPTNFNIATSINAYLAMKAALIQAVHHEKIQSVAIPAFCAGIGRMSSETVAKQMYMAYSEVVLGRRMDFSTFGESQKYHFKINPDGRIYE